MNDSDARTIKNLLYGGAAIGGGTAFLTSLMNYINTIKKKQYDSSEDDDVLYVYKDPNSGVAKAASVAAGVGIPLGIAGALGSYALVRALYNKFRENEVQKELDKAQRIFINTNGYKVDDAAEQEKQAGISAAEGVLSLPIALPALLTLASAVVTHRTLSNKFPGEVKSEGFKPKRIEVIEKKPVNNQDEYTSSVPSSEEESAEYAKVAGSTMEDDANDFLLRVVLSNPSKDSNVSNICKVAAMGGISGIRQTCSDLGVLPALDMMKGASAHIVDPVAEHLAICWMNKCAYLKAPISLLAASEFANSYPYIYKSAAALPEEHKDILYKLAAYIGNSFRSQRSEELSKELDTIIDGSVDGVTKEASNNDEEDILHSLLDKLNAKEPSEESNANTGEDLIKADPVTEGDDNESTNTSGQEAGISDPDSPSRPDAKDKAKFIASSNSMRQFSNDLPTDEIDELLSPTK